MSWHGTERTGLCFNCDMSLNPDLTSPAEPLAPPRSRQDARTTLAMGVLAFIVASVTHEVIGHGGTCWATGGHVTLISSVYFRGTDAGSLTDAAGPLANLIAGLIFLALLRGRKIRSERWVFFISAVTVLELFWGSGYFIYSAVSKRGDWAFLIADEHYGTLVRIGLGVLGIIMYRFSITTATRLLSPFSTVGDPTAPAGVWLQPALLLYLSAGLTCCLAALPYRGDVPAALVDSAIESFGAFIGLIFVASQSAKQVSTSNITEARGRPGDGRWILAAGVTFALFVAILGRGYMP